LFYILHSLPSLLSHFHFIITTTLSS
jgi:hypothetical protein